MSRGHRQQMRRARAARERIAAVEHARVRAEEETKTQAPVAVRKGKVAAR